MAIWTNENVTSRVLSSRWIAWKNYRRTTWLVLSAISILTLKCLLTDELTYPLHLVALHLAALALSQVLIRSDENKDENAHLIPSGPDGFRISSAILAVAYIGSLGATLGLGYKVIMYSSSLPIGMLILTLDWHPTYLTRRVLERQLTTGDAVRYLTFAIGTTMIYIWDYRLKFFFRGFFIAFLLLIGLLEELAARVHRTASEQRPSWWTYRYLSTEHWALFLLAPFVIIAQVSEIWRPTTWVPLYPTGVVIVINVVSTTAAIHVGGSIFRPLPPFSYTANLQLSKAEPRTERKILMLTLCGLVSAADWLIMPSPPATLSLWQYVGYFLALLAFLDRQDIDYCLAAWHSIGSNRSEHEEHSLQDYQLSALSHADGVDQSTRGSINLIILGAVSWLIFIWAALITSPPPVDYSKFRLDTTFKPNSKLDIVVNRYNEPATTVIKNLKLLLELPQISERHPRITIYNKNNDKEQFQASMQHAFADQLSIISLENIGREGDTYLHHIVTKWDDLAEHMFFMQDEPHHFPYLRQRLTDYFVPETGFMSFAYEGVICADCYHCHDTFGSDEGFVFADLYSKANPGECHDLVLTYRGQFIASAARIRAVSKSSYEEMLRDMRDPNSWMHAPEYTQSPYNIYKFEPDSLNAPVWGYALESMWGALMQCSELRVGYWSPSLLSGYIHSRWLGRKFPLENVQCLDRPVTPKSG